MIYPPFMFYGSKRREYKYIKKYFDTDKKIFIDIFGGSGVVGINAFNDYSYNVIYNDKDKEIFNFIKTIRDDKKLKMMINFFENLEINENTQKKINESEINPIYKYLFRIHFGFRGESKTLMACKIAKDGTKIFRKKRKYNKIFNDYNRILKKIEINNLDFEDLIKKYRNNKDVFIYCDPPYCSKNQRFNYKINFRIDQYIWLLDLLKDKNIKCSIMLNLDFSIFILDKYSDYIVHYYYKKYTGSTAENKFCSRYQVILTNYHNFKCFEKNKNINI